jgi:capsular exopolysaccharide synthesis family protein
LSRYKSDLKRYCWIVIVCTVVAALAGYVIAHRQPQEYVVNSVLLIDSGAPGTTYTGGPPPVDNMTLALSDAAQIQSLSTMEIVEKEYPELQQHKFTANDLLLDVVPAASTTAPTITLTATAPTPADAVMLANDVANGYVKYQDSIVQAQLTSLRNTLQSELTQQQNRVKNDENLINALPNTTVPQYQYYLNDLQHAMTNVDTLQGQLNQLPPTVNGAASVIQPATLAAATQSFRSLIVMGVTAAVGLIIGILVMLLVIFLDKRPRNENEIVATLGMAYLGNISKASDIRHALTSPTSSLAREAADIGANLRLTGVLPEQWSAPRGVALLVTSPRVAEGKSTTAIALASAIAQGGNRVVVVDGNLARPSTHLAFGMPATPGLSEILRGAAHKTIDNLAQRTKIPNVWLLTAGAPIPNAAPLLEQRLPQILIQLRNGIDVVIIDGPSLLVGAEAAVIASEVDGIALVTDARHNKLPILRRSKDILGSVTQKPIGIILNRFTPQEGSRYYAAAYPKQTAAQQQWVTVQGPRPQIVEAGNGFDQVPSPPVVFAPPFMKGGGRQLSLPLSGTPFVPFPPQVNGAQAPQNPPMPARDNNRSNDMLPPTVQQ